MRVQCQSCDQWFANEAAAVRHMDNWGHWQYVFQCETCSDQYMYQADCDMHMDEQGYWAPRYACETCDEQFMHQADMTAHMDDEGHWGRRYDCEGCNKTFRSSPEARQHMDQTNHWRNYFCEPNGKGFQNENNLQQHLRGGAHCTVRCPFCLRAFSTASGVAHHVESSSCPKARNIDRQKVYEMVNRADTRGVITNKQLTWYPEENCEQIATTAAWNGSSYECYYCHKKYARLISLNQHLSSSAHKQRIYHCFGPKCNRQFAALGQLFSHLESEGCGATRFTAVQQNANALFTGRKLIGF